MACCGQGRAQLRNAQPPATTSARAAAGFAQAPFSPQVTRPRPPAAAAAPKQLLLRYTESAPVLITGAVTGKRYQFSSAHALQQVDERDAASLLQTAFFRRAY